MTSKYELTLTPPLPAKCMGCGKDANGRTQFVDWHISIDFYGAVVFCIDCAKEMVTLFDMLPASALADAEDTISELLSVRVELEDKVEALERLAGIYGFSANPIDVSSDSAEVPEDDPAVVPEKLADLFS